MNTTRVLFSLPPVYMRYYSKMRTSRHQHDKLTLTEDMPAVGRVKQRRKAPTPSEEISFHEALFLASLCLVLFENSLEPLTDQHNDGEACHDQTTGSFSAYIVHDLPAPVRHREVSHLWQLINRSETTCLCLELTYEPPRLFLLLKDKTLVSKPYLERLGANPCLRL